MQASFYDDIHWIIDSGATDHMCNTIQLFQDLRDIGGNGHSITVLDGNKMVVKKISDVRLKEGLILKNVLLVPEIHFNLISVSKLTIDTVMHVLFTTNSCYL